MRKPKILKHPFFLVPLLIGFFILFIVIGMTVVAKINTNLVRINDAGGIPSEKANVPIFLNNKDSIYGLQFEISHEPFLILREVEPTKRMSGASIVVNNDTLGVLNIAALMTEGLEKGKGPIMKIVFDIPEEAVPGSYNLIFSKAIIGDINPEALPLETDNGIFHVVSDEKELKTLLREVEEDNDEE